MPVTVSLPTLWQHQFSVYFRLCCKLQLNRIAFLHTLSESEFLYHRQEEKEVDSSCEHREWDHSQWRETSLLILAALALNCLFCLRKYAPCNEGRSLFPSPLQDKPSISDFQVYNQLFDCFPVIPFSLSNNPKQWIEELQFYERFVAPLKKDLWLYNYLLKYWCAQVYNEARNVLIILNLYC